MIGEKTCLLCDRRIGPFEQVLKKPARVARGNNIIGFLHQKCYKKLTHKDIGRIGSKIGEVLSLSGADFDGDIVIINERR